MDTNKVEPIITVALPIWKARSIAWLFLESICNQNHPGVDWELLVCEENHDNMCGYSYLEPYIGRIVNAGGRVRYLPLKERMSLPNKWLHIANEAAESSKVYLMCASDNYYQPNMLRESLDGIVNRGADWFQSYRCHFYDIDTHKLVRYRKHHLTGIEMSMKTELAKKIMPSEKKRIIDLHVLRSVQPEVILWNDSESWVNTICTHGRNNISGDKRKLLLNQELRPFFKTDHELSDILPNYIYNKLTSL